MRNFSTCKDCGRPLGQCALAADTLFSTPLIRLSFKAVLIDFRSGEIIVHCPYCGIENFAGKLRSQSNAKK
jgi:hypothetical protein